MSKLPTFTLATLTQAANLSMFNVVHNNVTYNVNNSQIQKIKHFGSLAAYTAQKQSFLAANPSLTNIFDDNNPFRLFCLTPLYAAQAASKKPLSTRQYCNAVSKGFVKGYPNLTTLAQAIQNHAK